MVIAVSAVALAAIALAALVLLRRADARADEAVWRDLARSDRRQRSVFDPESVAGLPEPARRYFLHTLSPGAPLARVVEITMRGEIAMGGKSAPRYRPMRASQILAPPHGLVWRVESGALSGADAVSEATSWTRFRLFGLVPAVRAGGNADHHRSAMGRVVAEAAIWAPAALLPGPGVHWEPAGEDTARVTMRAGGFEHTMDITVAADGRPTRIVLQRWSTENADKTWRLQPFGGDLSEFRDFDGTRLPTHVEGGNLIGTENYFPFYRADVEEIRFVEG